MLIHWIDDQHIGPFRDEWWKAGSNMPPDVTTEMKRSVLFSEMQKSIRLAPTMQMYRMWDNSNPDKSFEYLVHVLDTVAAYDKEDQNHLS